LFSLVWLSGLIARKENKMINEDAISYGLLNEEEKRAIAKTLKDGYTPEKIEERLKSGFSHLMPSEIANYVGAARYIATHIQGDLTLP